MDNLQKALQDGLSQKSKVVVTERHEEDVANALPEPSELDGVIAKMQGDMPKGIMPAAQALAFIKELPLKVIVPQKHWNGDLGIVLTGDGQVKLKRNPEEGDVKFNAENADVLVKNMLYKAFAEGFQVNKWDMFIPGLNEKLQRADKVLSSKSIRAALKDMAKAGDIEVKLSVRYGAYTAPNLIVANKGSGQNESGKVNSALSAADLAFL